ncbi:nuclease-related domain-containing protein [Actinomadura hibisca]|uniref:nuclease-related domain-containing protein n=1 Tax=Actinomadura hibisca TaxID=68565 RepID=UPI00083353F7|nr:nuclease-related domain-containing protein [Actinomadura hibisca]
MRSSGGASNAGASAWARYRALAAEHRRERLLVQGVLAAGTGVVAAGVAVWWAGPAVAVVVFAGCVLYGWTRSGPMADWRQGAVAERRTGRRLARLDPAGHHVFHDRALPGATTNLDHLVVGLTGVYAIASRRWARGARVRVEGRRLWTGRRPVGSVGAAGRAARTVAELLSAELDHQVVVTPMVAVHGARVPRGGLAHGEVLVHAVREVPQVITARAVIFTSAQVATIAAAAERLLPPMLEESPDE